METSPIWRPVRGCTLGWTREGEPTISHPAWRTQDVRDWLIAVEKPRRRWFKAGFPPGTRCAYCLRVADVIERDHIVPFAKGGTETYDNITPCCRTCNARKRDKTLLEFVADGGCWDEQ